MIGGIIGDIRPWCFFSLLLISFGPKVLMNCRAINLCWRLYYLRCPLRRLRNQYCYCLKAELAALTWLQIGSSLSAASVGDFAQVTYSLEH
jgi:hypothetical protein